MFYLFSCLSMIVSLILSSPGWSKPSRPSESAPDSWTLIVKKGTPEAKDLPSGPLHSDGARWKAVQMWKDELGGKIYEYRIKGDVETIRSEISFLSSHTQNWPKFMFALGITGYTEEGGNTVRIFLPSISALQQRIDFYRGSVFQNPFQVVGVKGTISDEAYLHYIAKGLIPIGAPEHGAGVTYFHDIEVHLAPFMSIPNDVAKIMIERARTLLQMRKNASLFSLNFKSWLDYVVTAEAKTLDTASADLGWGMTKKDWKAQFHPSLSGGRSGTRQKIVFSALDTLGSPKAEDIIQMLIRGKGTPRGWNPLWDTPQLSDSEKDRLRELLSEVKKYPPFDEKQIADWAKQWDQKIKVKLPSSSKNAHYACAQILEN